jgi:methyl-accepting chemotaxis protein
MFLNDFNEIRERISNIEQEINSTKFAQLNAEIDDLVVNFKTNLSDAVINYIDKLDIDELKRQELRESTYRTIEQYESVVDDPPEYEAPSIVEDEFLGWTKISIDIILDNLTNPQLIFSFLAVLLLLALRSFTWFELGEKLSPLVNLILIILAAAFIWKVISSDNTKRLNEAKRKIIAKLLSSFDKQKFLNDSYESFVKTVDDIVDEVQKELQEVTDPYSKDVQQISDGVKEFQVAVKEINKFLKNQIEILESEQV